MSDFFDRIVSRADGRGRALEPRTASRYAPAERHLPLPDAQPGADDGAAEARALAEPAMPGVAETAAPVAGRPLGGMPPTDLRDRAEPGLEERDLPVAVTARPRASVGASLLEPPVAPVLAPPPAAGPPASAGRPGAAPASNASDGHDGPVLVRPPTRALAPVVAGEAPSGSSIVGPPPEPDAAAVPTAVPAAPAAGRRFATEDAFWSFLYPPSADGGPASAQEERGAGPGTLASVGARVGEPGRAASAGGHESRDFGGSDEGPGEAPEVTVSIERIDVRGLAAPAARAPARRGPRLGLQEYMQRSGSRRFGGSER